tara:strand:+ start:243 stop:449 length:207 start_codon:yes stop_codon:yes gene_type:complete
MSNSSYISPGLKKAWERLQKYKTSLSAPELEQYYSLQDKKSKTNSIEIRTSGSSSNISEDWVGETFHV